MITIHACCKDLLKSQSPESGLAQIYLKRLLSLGWKTQLRFYKKAADQEIAIEKAGNRVLILDALGKDYSSSQFAKMIFEHKMVGSCDLFIGPFEGFSKQLLEKHRHKTLSLSRMTFPHKVVIALLLEQLYRSATIIEGHPYDK